MKSNKGKGLLGLLGLLVVLGIFGFFGYDTLQKSKLVTDENGVTSQNQARSGSGRRRQHYLPGEGRESERRGYVRYPVQAAAESTELQL